MTDKPGWLITEGKLNDNDGANLLASIQKSLYSGKHRTTYKYGFLESILANIFSIGDNYELDLKIVNDTFALINWNLVVVHKLPQMSKVITGDQNGLDRAFGEIINANPEADGVYFESLSKLIQNSIRQATYKVFIKYVVGAFYADTEGYLYGFSKKQHKLWFNKKSYDFLNEFRKVIEQLNYFEWVKMVESILKRKNEQANSLATVIENISERNNLNSYRLELMRANPDNVCFYCSTKLKNKIHVDHFIPWSFIKNDYLWNFVLACPYCNTSKSDSIPAERYIKKLIDRNKRLEIEQPNIRHVINIAIKNGIKKGWEPRR